MIAYIDDTYVHDNPRARPEAPDAPPPWTQDNTTACIDVSCAYQKARKPTER